MCLASEAVACVMRLAKLLLCVSASQPKSFIFCTVNLVFCVFAIKQIYAMFSFFVSSWRKKRQKFLILWNIRGNKIYWNISPNLWKLCVITLLSIGSYKYQEVLSEILKSIAAALWCEKCDSHNNCILSLGGSLAHKTVCRQQKQRKKFRRRAAIEAVISHLKRQFRIGINYLFGKGKAQINAFLSAAAWNLKK